jgi:hypothetical protein
MGFTQEDIDRAKQEDTVGQWFTSQYIPNTYPLESDTPAIKAAKIQRYETAKKTMGDLLKKYGGRDGLEQDAEDWSRYQGAMAVVYSYSHDAMEIALKEQKDLIARKNRLSDFFESNIDLLFKLPVWARRNIRVYTDIGKLRGIEHLWEIAANAEQPAEVVLQIANKIYNTTGYIGEGDIGVLENGPVIYIRPNADCNGNWYSYIEYKEKVAKPDPTCGGCGGTC